MSRYIRLAQSCSRRDDKTDAVFCEFLTKNRTKLHFSFNDDLWILSIDCRYQLGEPR
jgi:tRNA(His) 5'-end guanylyltransferase